VKINKAKMQEAIMFVDEKLPVTSGRDFRIQSSTNKHLFAKYQESTPNPISLSTFSSKILKPLKIHHATVPASCHYCAGLAINKRKGSGVALEQHKLYSKIQQQQYLNFKKLIPIDKTSILIVQDFTQILFHSKNCQDLIISIYYYDENATNKIGHKFYNWLAQSKNDINFVIDVWSGFLPEVIDTWKPSSISIWSDGASKHFKTSRMLVWWWMQSTNLLKNIILSLHFFESYHGHNVCDGAASHVKQGILRYQKNLETIITKIEDLSSIIEKIANHQCTVKEINSEISFNIPEISFKNISKGHKFLFDPDGFIDSYLQSNDTLLFDTYVVPQVNV
jgi:hypothetical protein